jgi:hypothetical protein
MRLVGDGDRRMGGRRPAQASAVRIPQECGTLRRATFLHFATAASKREVMTMTLVFRWSLGLVLLAAASALSSCDMAGQVSESMAHAEPIAAEIEAAVGVKPHVFGATTGPVFFASVQFSEVPALSVPQLEAISRAAIVREYKKDLTSLTISFVYEKDPFGH